MATQDLRCVYLWVVDDCMTKIRPEYVHEGLDESVLLHIRRRWEEKMKAKGLLGPPEDAQPQKDDASSSQAAGTKRPYDGSGPAQAAVKLESHSLGMAPEGLPVLGAVPAVAGAPRMMAMPALQHLQSLQHMVNLQQAGMQGARLVAPGPGQAPVLMHMVTPHQYAAALAAQTAQQNSAAFAAAARPPAATAVLAATAAPPALHGVPAAAAPPQPQPGPRIPQSDGPGDDDGDDEGDVGHDEEEEEELEPVGPEDKHLDDSDDEAIQEEERECKNSVFCLYDKVHRSKNRWKCNLRAGVVNLDGKDYLFNKANAEMQFV